jgi:hypothetical protein
MKQDSKWFRKKAQKTPAFMRANEYIQARLFSPDLYSLLVEMGPNCDSRCFHCSSNCGPERRGLPSLDVLTEETLGSVPFAGITEVHLTLGEPLRDENRDVLKMLSKLSRLMYTTIVTSGKFAETQESAEEWINYLVSSGFDFSSSTSLEVSIGKMYPRSLERSLNILNAAKKVLTKISPGEYLSFTQIGVFEEPQDRDRINELLNLINSVFGQRKREDVKILERGKEVEVSIYPKKGPPIMIRWHPCMPGGRANSLTFLDENYPVRELTPDILHRGSDGHSLALFYNGDVSFSDCSGDFERHQPYGNIKKATFVDIIRRIRSDVFFQAYKLGCAALLYYVAQQVQPDFKVVGRSSWDVLDAIFHNKRLVTNMREYLKEEGIIDSYRRYVSQLDMRKTHLV